MEYIAIRPDTDVLGTSFQDQSWSDGAEAFLDARSSKNDSMLTQDGYIHKKEEIGAPSCKSLLTRGGVRQT